MKSVYQLIYMIPEDILLGNYKAIGIIGAL